MKFTKKQKKVLSRVLLEIPSAIFSSPVVTLLTAVLIGRMVPYLSLTVSSLFFYVLLPIITYAYLYKKGLITDKRFDFNIRKREERPLYNIIVILGFLTNYVLIAMYNIPVVEEIALFLAFFVFALVTFFWKISGHMTQTVLGILIFAYVFPDSYLPILLIGYLVFVPLVGLSRIKLKHHDLWQVVAGTLVTTFLGLLLFTIT